MALFISSLNSGSNGNSYYIGNDKEAILVDAGISCRTIEKRLKNLELDIHLIKAIFISHEHTDHIKGVETLTRKYNIPVYISKQTYQHSGLTLAKENLFHFVHDDVIRIGDISLHAFSKTHDAIDPFSFYVDDHEVRVGVFTDLGVCCDHLIKSFHSCHAAFLEANYDEQMLETGSYPFHLKRRISGGKGHLSNRQAFKLFTEHRQEFMSHLILAHLSENNNDPKIVEQLFKSDCGNVNVFVASRHEASPVFEIRQNKSTNPKRLTYIQSTIDFGI